MIGKISGKSDYERSCLIVKLRHYAKKLDDKHADQRAEKEKLLFAADALSWSLEPALDSEEVINRVITKYNYEEFKQEDMTCWLCFNFIKCDYRNDIYNVDGDCLAEK